MPASGKAEGRRTRLYEGKWVSAAGQIWENFDPAVHVLDHELRCEGGHWSLWAGARKVVDVAYFIAGVDWGFRAPGSMLVVGIDTDNIAYIVHEVYRVRKDLEWWADVAEQLRQRYDILRFICDPSRPENIERFNTRLSRAGGYHLSGKADIAGGANNAIQAGLSVVRERFANRTLFVLSGALERQDPLLAEAKKPCSLAEEIPSYIYREIKDGHAVRDEPAPDSDDHACDALRYVCLHLDTSDWRSSEENQEHTFPPGSFGAVLGHAEVFEAMESGEV